MATMNDPAWIKRQLDLPEQTKIHHSCWQKTQTQASQSATTDNDIISQESQGAPQALLSNKADQGPSEAPQPSTMKNRESGRIPGMYIVKENGLIHEYFYQEKGMKKPVKREIGNSAQRERIKIKCEERLKKKDTEQQENPRSKVYIDDGEMECSYANGTAQSASGEPSCMLISTDSSHTPIPTTVAEAAGKASVEEPKPVLKEVKAAREKKVRGPRTPSENHILPFIKKRLEEGGCSAVQWVNRETRVWKVVDRDKLAKIWSEQKGKLETYCWGSVRKALGIHYGSKLRRLSGDKYQFISADTG